MATHRNLLPNSSLLKRVIYMIIGFALLGLLTGLFFGAATLFVSNQLG